MKIFAAVSSLSLLVVAVTLLPVAETARAQSASGQWRHLSSEQGELAVPNEGDQQTASLVLDIDGDGDNDFVITERTEAPSVVWYERGAAGWTRHVLEDEALTIEAGGDAYDIDGDGDFDIVFGGDGQSNEVWWWENPSPNYEAPWPRHTIMDEGANKHHDELFGDFDGDGEAELVFWNQGGQTLYLAEIPENPRQAGAWDVSIIYRYSSDSQMEQRGSYPGWKDVNEHEGLYKADIDGDGTSDLVGGGRWFKHVGDHHFQENIIDASYPFSRAAVGDLIEEGRPEVVLVAGDGVGPLMLYEYREGTWVGNTLIEGVQDGHSLDVLDVNGDGYLDIFSAEMRLGENPDAKARILLGDGRGRFEHTVVAEGYGMHEAKLADLDGDGDLDLLGKSYTWEAPRLDIWLNEGTETSSR